MLLGGDRGFSGGGREREMAENSKRGKKARCAMLVLAQKKRFTWRLLMMWAGNQVAGVWWITVFRMQFAWPFL